MHRSEQIDQMKEALADTTRVYFYTQDDLASEGAVKFLSFTSTPARQAMSDNPVTTAATRTAYILEQHPRAVILTGMDPTHAWPYWAVTAWRFAE